MRKRSDVGQTLHASVSPSQALAGPREVHVPLDRRPCEMSIQRVASRPSVVAGFSETCEVTDSDVSQRIELVG